MIIARKLARFLNASDDTELLDFARETIGAGVTARRHQGVIKDLRVACMLRKSLVQRRAMAAGLKAGPGQQALRSMSLAKLVEAAGSERGPRLKMVMVELEQRKGEEVINALGAAATSYEPDVQQLARGLLVRHLGRQGGTVVKAKLKDDRAVVRAAAAQVVGAKGWRFGGEKPPAGRWCSSRAAPTTARKPAPASPSVPRPFGSGPPGGPRKVGNNAHPVKGAKRDLWAADFEACPSAHSDLDKTRLASYHPPSHYSALLMAWPGKVPGRGGPRDRARAGARREFSHPSPERLGERCW